MRKIRSFFIKTRTVFHIGCEYPQKAMLLDKIINHNLIVAITRYQKHFIELIFDIFSHRIEHQSDINVALLITFKSFSFFIKNKNKSSVL